VTGLLPILTTAAALAAISQAATLKVGPGRPFAAPCAAIAAASPGDTIEIDASGTYSGDVCAWSTGGLTLRGAGGRARIDAAGRNSQGKAIWVIAGDNTLIEDIEFTGARVPDQNGAAIRQEGANLTVRRCYFHDNEEGILTSANARSEIVIEFSEFARNGYGDGYSHNLYIGHIAKFTMRYCYSHHSWVGHLVKSRAAENYLLYNRFSDEAAGTGSYEIDLPNGGNAYIIGNLIEQGPLTENPNLLAWHEEGGAAENPGTAIYVVNNTFVNDGPSGNFVMIGAGAPSPAVIRNNIFAGPGAITNQAAALLSANRSDANPAFADRTSYDYRLTAASPAVNAGVDPGAGLVPQYQYLHPACAQARLAVGAVDAGAYEYGGAGALLACTQASPPAAPVLASPANQATAVPGSGLTLEWIASSGAEAYDVYFGASNPPPLAANTNATNYSPPAAATPGITYYWSVTAKNAAGSASSPVWWFTVAAAAPVPVNFVPLAPCRLVDTRAAENVPAPFGAPSLGAGESREFPFPLGRCAIPSTARAYSVNITVVPRAALGFLTLWPAGSPRPLASTLNAPAGGIVANAAIVPAGAGGAVSVYATDATDLIVDVNGYFDLPGASAYSFFATSPCRLVDTRNAAGALGGPALASGVSRDFPLALAPCGLPSSARAYSLNATVVPAASRLGYVTLYPAGGAMPLASTLNSPNGSIVANAALVPAGSGGSVAAYSTDRTHLVLDANGYFAPTASASAPLAFMPVTPCRLIDTRGANGVLGGPPIAAGTTREVAVLASACAIPQTARAYSLNVTVVPQQPLDYLAIWPAGAAQPLVSTLNSPLGLVLANAAVVPAGAGGALTVFATGATHLVIDINGYFVP
jgi:hypothetical protein